MERNQEQMKEIKALRQITGLNRKQFSENMGIPLRTVEDWEAGRRKMPGYLLRLLTYNIYLEYGNTQKHAQDIHSGKNVSIITDCDGKKLVVINDIRFKGKRNIDWDSVENYLKEYVGKCYEIAETSDKVYIGTDFPDEFAHAKDRKKLTGMNAKAKANSAQAIPEMVQIATGKTSSPDYLSKHKDKAMHGWYRYDTRFALPVYDEDGSLERYNVFSVRMLVRHAGDGKLYLYDMLRTKKETSKPLEQLAVRS